MRLGGDDPLDLRPRPIALSAGRLEAITAELEAGTATTAAVRDLLDALRVETARANIRQLELDAALAKIEQTYRAADDPEAAEQRRRELDAWTIVAALAIYGERANLPALIAKARALNDARWD